MKEVKEVKNTSTSKLGVVEFSREFSGISETSLEMRKNVYQFVTPIRSYLADERHMRQSDMILCYCDQFREVKEAEMYPKYELTMKRHEDGSITLEKVEELDRNGMVLKKPQIDE